MHTRAQTDTFPTEQLGGNLAPLSRSLEIQKGQTFWCRLTSTPSFSLSIPTLVKQSPQQHMAQSPVSVLGTPGTAVPRLACAALGKGQLFPGVP